MVQYALGDAVAGTSMWCTRRWCNNCHIIAQRKGNIHECMRTKHFISVKKYEGSVSKVQLIGVGGHTRMIPSSHDLDLAIMSFIIWCFVPIHALLIFLFVTQAGAADHGIKVHAKDTNCRVVSRPKVDGFLNPKPKVAHLGKVAPMELVLLHLSSDAALKDLFPLL